MLVALAPLIMMIRISSQHEALIEALTMGVRFLSVGQIALTWCGGDLEAAVSLVEELQAEKLVTRQSFLVHPELEVVGPEFEWTPSDEAMPDFKPIAYRLRKRWSEQKTMVELVFPERGACERFGGTHVRPRPSEISHDLHFGSVYLYVSKQIAENPNLHWVSGDTLRSHHKTGQFGGSVPDAILNDSQGAVQMVIEGGGKYGRAKLEAIHRDYCSTPYQIW